MLSKTYPLGVVKQVEFFSSYLDGEAIVERYLSLLSSLKYRTRTVTARTYISDIESNNNSGTSRFDIVVSPSCESQKLTPFQEKILELVADSPEVTNSKLFEKLDGRFTLASISSNLSLLKRRGLVLKRKRGRFSCWLVNEV
jgi:predicted HTH transcriptional regulator